MQAPRFASRLLAALLTATWAALALSLLASPAGGGTTSVLLALAASVPALAAAAAIVWPAEPAGRDGRVVGWLGVAALLLTVPFAMLVGGPRAAGVAQPIVPSAAMAYAGLLCVLGTTVYAAHGWLEMRRRRRPSAADGGGESHRRAAVIGLLLSGLVAMTTGVALAGSPASLEGLPPACGPAVTAPYARVTIDARAELDGTTIATATVSGERGGADEHWSGTAGGTALAARSFEYTRTDARGVLRTGGGGWQPAGESDAAADGHLDRRLAAVLAAPDLPPIEDLGLDLVAGAAARHCRISLGGPQALRAFLPLAWLLDRPPLDRGPAVAVWRGDLDWWTFAGGQLGRATVLVGGHPGDAWTGAGLRGVLRAEMRVTERDLPRQIEQPPGSPEPLPLSALQ